MMSRSQSSGQDQIASHVQPQSETKRLTGLEEPDVGTGDHARPDDRTPVRDDDLRLMFESLGDGVYGMDRQSLCSFVSRRALDPLGYEEPGDLVGRHIHNLIHHTRPDGSPYPAHECPLMCTLTDGEPVLLDDELLWRRDGTSFYAEYASHPIRVAMMLGGDIAVISAEGRGSTFTIVLPVAVPA